MKDGELNNYKYILDIFEKSCFKDRMEDLHLLLKLDFCSNDKMVNKQFMDFNVETKR